MPPTFSVIIPTFDRPDLLMESVASVLAQDFDDLECIVVDDGGSESLVLPDDSRLKIVRHAVNRGLPAALNSGLDAARGEYVTFLDDDDLLAPGRLSIAVSRLGDAGVVLCKWVSLGGRTRGPASLEGRVYDTILDTWAPPKGAAVIARSAIPRFDERYHALEDLEWWLRVADHLTFTTVDELGYLIRPHDRPRNLNGPAARVGFGLQLLRERDDYFSEHRCAAAQRWYAIGLIAMQLGDNRLARRAFARSLGRWPVPKRFGHLALSLRRSTVRLDVEKAA